MTTNYLSINKGQLNLSLGANVVVATSAPTADFFLQIDMSHNPNRFDVIQALKSFENYINSNGVPAGLPGTDLPVL